MLERCPGNVVGKADGRGNLYPTKNRPDQKIDAAVALMMAMGRAMVEDEEARGLEGFLTNLSERRSASPHRDLVLTCLSNVVGKADRRGNLYPTKSRPDQKIDAAVALMMAVGRAMVEDQGQVGLNGFLSNPIAF
jgi:phage terminase large subunit-like protein